MDGVKIKEHPVPFAVQLDDRSLAGVITKGLAVHCEVVLNTLRSLASQENLFGIMGVNGLFFYSRVGKIEKGSKANEDHQDNTGT